MELGEKLLQERKQAGLSQRQLCGDVITRNMLSQIEHGTARPSMATLQYLAARLGKPVSFFLEEEMEVSPNQSLMSHARRAYGAGEYEETRLVLAGFQQPDGIFDLEYRCLYADTTLRAAKAASAAGKSVYARELLAELQPVTEQLPALERRRLLLLGELTDSGLGELCRMLPGLDEELYLRARAALEEKQWDRGLRLLDAMEERDAPQWHLLRGKLCMGKGDYETASQNFRIAESAYPAEAFAALECCYREQGDFKKAYYYACKQRER